MPSQQLHEWERSDSERCNNKGRTGCARLTCPSFYDAVYLELAKRHTAPIATLDKALARAADAEGLPLVCDPQEPRPPDDRYFRKLDREVATYLASRQLPQSETGWRRSPQQLGDGNPAGSPR